MANTILSVNAKRYIEIGYNIQYYRKHKNLTQERLAKLLDISTKCSLAIKFILNRQTFLSCLFLFFRSLSCRFQSRKVTTITRPSPVRASTSC